MAKAQSNADVSRAAEYFRSLGLQAEPIPEGSVMTPDLAVKVSDNLVAYCEVKSIEEWELTYPPGSALSETLEGNDATVSSIGAHIHKAYKQLTAVNPDAKFLNLIALVNHNQAKDAEDLICALTGDFFTEGGKRFPLYRKVSEGRMSEEKTVIDVYLWFQLDAQRPVHLVTASPEGRFNRTCALLGLDQSSLERIHW